jgi:hypothetical protein
MSNAALGEPLALQHATVKWSAQGAFGTPVTPATSAGLGMAGKRKISNNWHGRGPGSPNFVARKGGSAYTEWALRYAAVQTGIKGLLQRAVRVNGMLPLTTLGIGYEDDQGPSNKSMDQIQDCVINTLELSLDAFNEQAPLAANLSGFGSADPAVLTNQARALLTSTPWVAFEAIFTKDAAAFECGQFSLNVNHNASRDYIIPGQAPTSPKRSFRYATAHDEMITGSITRYRKLGHNVHLDTPPSVGLQLVFNNLDDAQTLTLPLTDVDFANENEEHTEQGLRWSADFEARLWGLT